MQADGRWSAVRRRRGPERLVGGWWRGHAGAPGWSRDYYAALLADGRGVWIYREREAGRWWLQGWFG